METQAEHGAQVRFPPPLVFFASVLVGILMHAFALPLSLPLPAPLRAGAAAILFIAGVALMAGALRLFRNTGQDVKPWMPTPEIICGGVYRISRNPMYLAMALMQIAIGIGLANGWVVALVIPVLFIIYTIAIRQEEHYLEQKFGETYLRYKGSVRRWL